MNIVDSYAWLEYFANSKNASNFGLATARKHKAVIWTQDPDFKGLENVSYFSKN